MKWFLVVYLFNCQSIIEENLNKCPSVPHQIAMPSKEICKQVKEINGITAECWAKENEK